ncbi:MAG TPA: Ig-like domain-containing protein, partial [Chthoniobacterales bacterium]
MKKLRLLQATVLACVLNTSSAFAAPTITATQDDATAAATRKAVGDTITYTTTINNTAAAGAGNEATGVQLTNPTPANTTDVAGVRITPIAVDDAYNNIVGNTQRTVNAAGGLLANDFDPDGAAGTFSVKPGSVSRVSGTATGGAVAVNADGSFTYTPGVGQTGTERFQYTITDAHGQDSVTPGFVDFTINAPRVWYVQNGTVNGTGRSHEPFNSLAAASTAANAATDIIYVFSDIGANAKLNGNVVLETGQQLLGQGVALVVDTLTLFNASAAPTLTNSAAAPNGDVVTLAQNNTVRGLIIGNHPNGSGIVGSSVGSLTVNSMTINGTGKIADLTGAAGNNVAVTFDNATTTSSTSEGIKLTGLIGNVTVTAGAISGAAGADVLINGGTANFTFPGTITNTAGRSVDIQNRTGGTVAFSGPINETGTGIFLNSNT